MAGLRTFSLIGLTGGVLASLGSVLAPWALGAGLLGLAALLTVSYRESVRADGDLSATTAVAAVLTMSLGALAASGYAVSALAAAVVAAVLLDYKSTLHGWLRLVERRELRAALQMGVLSIVVLPLLPDEGFGPHGVLNPYRLWWAVVLLAALSLAGHVAMRMSGPQRGLLLTGILGGVATSTAATLALAQRVRHEPGLLQPALAGAVAASGMMFLRMLIVVGVLQPALAQRAALPMLAGAAVLFGRAAWHWRRRGDSAAAASANGEEVAPFDLGTILGFGALLAAVSLLVDAGKDWFGAAGVYGVVVLSSLVDVDPVVVSLARMHAQADTSAQLPLIGLGLAALSSLVLKSGMARSVGGPAFGWRLAGDLLASVLAGAAGIGLLVWL